MRPGLRIFVFVAPAALLFLSPRASGGGEEIGEIRAWQRETLLALAAEAGEAGHATLARRCLIHAARAGLEGEDIERARAGLADREDDPSLSPRKRAKLEKRLDDYREDAARRLATAAEGAEGDDARSLAGEARRLDPENEDAREVLGQVRLRDWGWVAADDAKRLRAGQLPIDDGWAPKREVARGQAVIVTSDHYRLRSQLPLERTFALRDLLEAYHAKWRNDWEGVLPLSEDGRRHEVLIFATKSGYESHLEATDPQRILGVPGQYSPNKKRAVFYDVESLRTDTNQTSSLAELMLHECTHQMVHEEVEGRPEALEGAEAPNFWVHEGIAEFYGMHTLGREGLHLDRRAVGRMLRTTWLRERFEKVPALPQLDAMGRQAFLSKDGEQRTVNYAYAGFLCLYLADGDHTAAFRRIVRAVYCEGNPPGCLAALVDENLERLDRKFRAFFRRL